MSPFTVIKGTGPILLSQPHSGTYVPEAISAQMTNVARELGDTDWHIPALYEGLLDTATVVRANFSRYVIDPNRDPSGKSLYPGQSTTDLVPLTTFEGEALWIDPPNSSDIQARLEAFHHPYHNAIKTELERIKSKWGIALLYDCHSIESQVPRLFEGRLPDLNIGTYQGRSCASWIKDTLEQACRRANQFSVICDGRFQGGWTTRHYGHPESGIHAIQMELTKRLYLDRETPPCTYDPAKAAPLRAALKTALNTLTNTLKINTIKHEDGDLT